MKRIKLFERFITDLMLNIHGFPEKGYRDKYHGYLYGSLGYYHKCKQELEVHIKETEDYINKQEEKHKPHRSDLTIRTIHNIEKNLNRYREMIKRFKLQLEEVNKKIDSINPHSNH
jgi:sugar-specific transcriptional regulator TrmB